ncbi:J domain-containing protein [Pseudomonas sp. GL-B-16]|uniref:J domain-containing protein n=1 Tax=Pseudomonas sp. GL-B-16 TaxID=2832373 RepID=UPI001CBDA0F2|nr:J domain-containing protein [Pseudomonas sp. GL-B-16]
MPAKPKAKPLYERMSLPGGASDEDIKRAYKKGVLKHHPDKHPDDPLAQGRFIQFREAYEILSDPQRRSWYDSGLIDEKGHVIPPQQEQAQ